MKGFIGLGVLALCLPTTYAFVGALSGSPAPLLQRHTQTRGVVCRGPTFMTASDADGEETYAEAKIVVKGQAHGGYFRAQARNEAYFNRRLCGALKELPDGGVEMVVSA
ncbi:unnamed protein product [Chrysoparadoxa australica]